VARRTGRRYPHDTNKGQTNGEGLNAFGAEWYALSAAAAKVEKRGSWPFFAPARATSA